MLDEPFHFDGNASAAPLVLVYVNKKSMKRHFTEFYNNKRYSMYDFLLRLKHFLAGKTSHVLYIAPRKIQFFIGLNQQND